MTEQTTENPEAVELDTEGERQVPFMGRTFTAHAPTPEQLLVWQRTLDNLAGQDTAKWDGKQAMAALSRIRKIIDSLLSPADIEWIDDRMLEMDPDTRRSRFTLENAHELMMLIIDSFKVKNRAERREEARVTKAQPARRVPAKKAPAKKTTRRAS